MKPVKLLLLSAAVCFSGLCLNAQPHALLQGFSGFQQDELLILRWTFKSGSLCEGTRVERSADGQIYDQIGEIPGICGNPETAFSYTFVDSLPKRNAVNYYRLELGNYGYSSSVSVEFIDPGNSDFVVLSAYSGQTEVLFQNIPGRTGTAVLFSSNGKRIAEFGISGKRFSLPSGQFSSGVYLLLLAFNDNTSVSGNIVIP